MSNSAQAARSLPAVVPMFKPAAPADRETLRRLVLVAMTAQIELTRAMRALEEAAGNGPWRGDLVISLEKSEASGFWFREGTRSLQAGKGCKLLPDSP